MRRQIGGIFRAKMFHVAFFCHIVLERATETGCWPAALAFDSEGRSSIQIRLRSSSSLSLPMELANWFQRKATLTAPSRHLTAPRDSVDAWTAADSSCASLLHPIDMGTSATAARPWECTFCFRAHLSRSVDLSRLIAFPEELMSEERGRPLPKFGEWDVNDPASAEGFTVIFNKARDEKKTGANTRETDSPAKEDPNFKPGTYSSKSPSKKWFCCMQGSSDP